MLHQTAQQKPSQALLQFIHAQTYPENLGEGKNPADDILIGCLSGMAYQAMNQNEQANLSFKRVVETERDLAIWNCHTPFAFYAAQALTHLGENQAAKEKFQALLDFATESLSKEAEPEFSTSRPNMEVFDEDPRQVNRIHAYYLMILAYSGLGNRAGTRQALEDLLAIDPYFWPVHFFLKINSLSLNFPVPETSKNKPD